VASWASTEKRLAQSDHKRSHAIVMIDPVDGSMQHERTPRFTRLNVCVWRWLRTRLRMIKVGY
jgi:hypothetical protein